jgi:hypothetical protein
MDFSCGSKGSGQVQAKMPATRPHCKAAARGSRDAKPLPEYQRSVIWMLCDMKMWATRFAIDGSLK